ncbi:MAG: hypothetical protein V3V06_03025 [Dehalococcoidia bacterium]
MSVGSLGAPQGRGDRHTGAIVALLVCQLSAATHVLGQQNSVPGAAPADSRIRQEQEREDARKRTVVGMRIDGLHGVPENDVRELITTRVGAGV